jgi:hypothetical protein
MVRFKLCDLELSLRMMKMRQANPQVYKTDDIAEVECLLERPNQAESYLCKTNLI